MKIKYEKIDKPKTEKVKKEPGEKAEKVKKEPGEKAEKKKRTKKEGADIKKFVSPRGMREGLLSMRIQMKKEEDIKKEEPLDSDFSISDEDDEVRQSSF